MEFTHFQQDQILILTPELKTLDARDAPDFKEKALTLIGDTSAQQVIFDLHHLQFIDSSGLGALLSILRHLTAQGGDLKIAELNKPVRAVFELVSMHKIFEIYQTKEDALRSFGPKVNT